MTDVRKSFRGLAYAAAPAALACLALAVAGPANADDLNSTTCTEQQILASIKQNDPVVWANINGDPKLEQQLQVGLAVLLAAPPGQRQQQVNTSEGILGYERWAGVSNDIMDTSNGPIGRAVSSCHNF